jgi:hypothetical protein
MYHVRPVHRKPLWFMAVMEYGLVPRGKAIKTVFKAVCVR